MFSKLRITVGDYEKLRMSALSFLWKKTEGHCYDFVNNLVQKLAGKLRFGLNEHQF
jgi:hypothetical protein